MVILRNSIVIYTEASEMPIKREWAFRKYILYSNNELGDPMQAAVKVARFIESEAYDNALQMCKNWYQSIYLVSSMFDPNTYAFAALVKSIEGVEYNDLTEDGLKLVVDKLAELELTSEEIVQQVYDVKKKVTLILEKFYPEIFSHSKMSRNFIGTYKTMLNELIKISVEDNADAKAYNEMHHHLFTMLMPLSFDPDSRMSADVQHELALENMAATLSEFTSKDVKEMTVLEFYALVNRKVSQQKRDASSTR